VDSLIRTLIRPDPDIAIVAVGGYGRGRLAPHSDIDVLALVRFAGKVPGESLRSLLYPLWDQGYRVGHAVRTPKEAIDYARADVCALTALLSARFITGAKDLFDDMMQRRDRSASSEIKRFVRSIVEAAKTRRAQWPRAGWSLAPNVKEAAGGTRDLDTVEWLQILNCGAHVPATSLQAGQLMHVTREALHQATGRRMDVLHIELQSTVASHLGFKAHEVDDLMMRVHFAAREIEYNTSLALEATTARVLGGPKRTGTTSHVAPGVSLTDGQLELAVSSDMDLPAAIRLMACASQTGRPIALQQYWKLEKGLASAPRNWTEKSRDEWLHLLKGTHVVPVLELLDNLGGLTKLLPEWSMIRGRAQHDPYHLFTVDGHCFLTVAEVTKTIHSDAIAGSASTEAGNLSSLYLAALLHDIGKGSGENHSIVGERLSRSVCRRIGVDPNCTEEVALLVRLHLLLSDTATRRDLDDGSVIEGVAKQVGDARLLKLLYVLSVADGKATGPHAWSDWKASLVRDLYRKALIALTTGNLPARSDAAQRAREIEALEPSLTGRAHSLLAGLPPSYLSSATASEMADDLVLLSVPLAIGEIQTRIERASTDRTLVTLCALDRPGTLARAAGVLSLHRIQILKAQAYSTSTGRALERFIVRAPSEDVWTRFKVDLDAAFTGRLALDARLRQKAIDYKELGPPNVDVRILNNVSEDSTVVEVRTRDALGLLYTIAAAMAELDANIHVAKIDTLGERVVDVFYVRNHSGRKLEEEQVREVDRAIRDRIARALSEPTPLH
jgi:[protein-PII] uridylyltransferase